MLIGPQLWTQLIAMIQRDCPMLVPTVVQDSSGMSDDQWKAATGFRADDTVDTYVKRCKNLTILMAAIAVTPPMTHNKATAAGAAHPWPMKQAWVWLARLLNQIQVFAQGSDTVKMPMATGPVLEGFIKIAGHDMQSAFGKQFTKLLHTISTEVKGRLLANEDVPHLLDAVLDETEKNGWRVAAPKGRKQLERYRTWGQTD
eukprot:TRINITY_DN2273_c0_g1_i1.p1 TRINITY_DN2273_c0_g1~~TRINITY_DN2273_c0_g1_i1.p1  ORF type:complete len:201 (-),score=41.65 TRINITY_DN2273_c0_g1_i1:79-681(-)